MNGHIRFVTLSIWAAAAGCGGNSTENGLLVRTETVAAGAQCEAGGVRVVWGVDDDGDGDLSTGEVDTTEVLCGEQDDASAVVRQSPEAAGANCSTGGVRLDVGFDADDDGMLDPAERTTTSYVCAGESTRLDALELSVSQLDEPFRPSVTDYSATVGFLATSIRLRAAVEQNAASLSVNGRSIASGDWSEPVALLEGDNLVAIEVTFGATRRYTVNVRRKTAQTFAQRVYLKASEPGRNDGLGYSVALDGDTLAVGLPGAVGDAGAALIFTRRDGQWRQQAVLTASNADVDDRFGTCVALDGDTLAVGAPGEDSGGEEAGPADNSAAAAGAVYVFTRRDGEWMQEAHVKAAHADAGDLFGTSVALDGETLAIGAPGEDGIGTGVNEGDQTDNARRNSGAVYVFERQDNAWRQEAYAKASNPDRFDDFGYSVALDGDTLAAGAPQEGSRGTGVDGPDQADNSTEYSGAVYVFSRVGERWRQDAYLKASNTGPNDRFGFSLAIDDRTLVVGAPSGVGDFEDSPITAGAVYVFTRSDGGWRQQDYLTASGSDIADQFGFSVALDGDSLGVGAPFEASRGTGVNGPDPQNNSAEAAGAAYVFTRRDGQWGERAYLKASNTDAGDEFGHAVALAGDTLASGAPAEKSRGRGINGAGQANNTSGLYGAVYVYR